ncbi:twin-arginine translocation signal domain-containing protein [Niabella sp. 22666]|uniref:twin-arginine translocation signal domain-containing protein n=1 Tax=Niabella sp. 22666 TaxID=3453954 RepID=UPI003F83335B
MSALQASRRGFLSNLAILTAGVAIGSNTSGLFITQHKAKTDDLETMWASFCESRLASPYLLPIENRREIEACKGHEHREGKAVYFSEEGMIAQPVWIYWGTNTQQPSDVIISFYQSGGRINSINQYELKSLSEATAFSGHSRAGSLSFFLESKNQKTSSLAIKTIIKSTSNVLYLT